MGLLQLFSLVSSARSLKSTLATVRTTVGQLRESAQTYQTASFQRTREKAQAGDLQAQDHLGESYYEGRGVARDDREAFAWFEQAAQGGLAKAQCSVGLMLFFGRAGSRRQEEGYGWIVLAATQDYAPALQARERARRKLDSPAQTRAEQWASTFQPRKTQRANPPQAEDDGIAASETARPS